MDTTLTEVVKKAQPWIEKVERACAGLARERLLERPSEYDLEPDALRVLSGKLDGTAWLAHALRTFPRFDLRALNQVRKTALSVHVAKHGDKSRDVTIQAWMPAFAIAELEPRSFPSDGTFRPFQNGTSFPWTMTGGIDQRYVVENRRAFMKAFDPNAPEGFEREIFDNMGGYQLFVTQGGMRNLLSETTVVAIRPPVPEAKRGSLATLAKRFHNTILAWEAEWLAASMPTGKDPLVIGVIDGLAFLLDQWDATKLEAYVAREFTTEPQKGA